MSKAGIVVGTNQQSAWLLPWWWRHYSRHNSLPVTFVDFGVADDVAEWCEARGNLVRLERDLITVAPREKVDPELVELWEHTYGKNVWEVRKGWFFKPLAMQASPYEMSLWLDLDCEVCANLQPIFDSLGSDAEMGVTPDSGRPGIYNSGVIVFRKESQLLKDWAQACKTDNYKWIGDDYILSPLIATQQYSFQALPQEYNWIGGMGINSEALIMHWVANWGKMFIETHGGYQDYKDSLLGLRK